MNADQILAASVLCTAKTIEVRGVGAGRKICPACKRIVVGPNRKVCNHKGCGHVFLRKQKPEAVVENAAQYPALKARINAGTKADRLKAEGLKLIADYQVEKTAKKTSKVAAPKQSKRQEILIRIARLNNELSAAFAELAWLEA